MKRRERERVAPSVYLVHGRVRDASPPRDTILQAKLARLAPERTHTAARSDKGERCAGVAARKGAKRRQQRGLVLHGVHVGDVQERVSGPAIARPEPITVDRKGNPEHPDAATRHNLMCQCRIGRLPAGSDHDIRSCQGQADLQSLDRNAHASVADFGKPHELTASDLSHQRNTRKRSGQHSDEAGFIGVHGKQYVQPPGRDLARD
jgi:hypothetical protein